MKPIVFIFGEGLVGKMVHRALTDAGDVTVVSSTQATMDYHLKSEDPYDDLKLLTNFMIGQFGKPALMINLLGVIGKPNVDWCEDHQQETYYGNVKIPVAMAKVAAELDIPLVHISTGCIFDSVKKFDEDSYTIFRDTDTPNFEGSYYSYTKAEAERLLKQFQIDNDSDIEIHRIRMPFFGSFDDRNLFNKLVKYDTLVDFPNSMTCLEDYADWFTQRVPLLIDGQVIGWSVVHAVNKGPISHKEIVEMIREFTDIKIGEKKYITPADLNKMTKAPRSNCVMTDEVLPDIRVSIVSTLRKLTQKPV